MSLDMIASARRKKGLLIAPKFPVNSFWGYQSILRFLGKKAAFPPVGLITFAADMPAHWDFELIDCNVETPDEESLREKIQHADAVFASAMSIQKPSLVDLLKGPAKGTTTPWVLGGPYASSYRDEIMHPTTPSDAVLHEGLDLIVFGDSRNHIRAIEEYLEKNPRHSAHRPTLLIPQQVLMALPGSQRHLEDRTVFTELVGSNPPRWDLIDMDAYATMMMQTTEGCPFRCNFCDVINFTGGFTRAKSREDVVREHEQLYQFGYRGAAFTVDDNFIGSIPKISGILDSMIGFQREHNYPFTFFTQASVNLGLQKNEFLIRKMREAGFSAVFLGIETPDPATLRGMNKKQNLQVDLVETVRKIQAMGIEVYAGFIYGSDEDTRAAAQTIIDFVEQVPIFSAMTGMLTPVPHTPLYEQLREEGRLLPAEFTGNNVDDAIQLIPKNMSVEEMREGFHSILTTLFTAKHAYGRALRVLEQIQPHIFSGKNLIPYIQAAFLSLWEQGIKRRDWEYFKLLWEAWKLDRKAYHAAEQEQTALKQLWGPEGTYAQQQPPWNETARASFEKIVGYARDYWIRFQPEKTLEEIRAYAGKLEQDVGAARTVPPADVQAVYCAAGEFLEARKKQFSFPGAYLPLAFNLAIKALHYENVMKATVGKSPEQIAICYGKSAEENIIPKVAVG